MRIGGTGMHACWGQGWQMVSGCRVCTAGCLQAAWRQASDLKTQTLPESLPTGGGPWQVAHVAACVQPKACAAQRHNHHCSWQPHPGLGLQDVAWYSQQRHTILQLQPWMVTRVESVRSGTPAALHLVCLHRDPSRQQPTGAYYLLTYRTTANCSKKMKTLAVPQRYLRQNKI